MVALVCGLVAFTAQAYLIKVDFNSVNTAGPSDPPWNVVSSNTPLTLNDTSGTPTPIQLTPSGNFSGTILGGAGAFIGTDWEEASRDFMTGGARTYSLSGFDTAEVVNFKVIANNTYALAATYQVDGLAATGPDHDGVAYDPYQDGYVDGSVMEWDGLTGKTSYDLTTSNLTSFTSLVGAMSIEVIPEPGTLGLVALGLAGLMVRRRRR